MVSLNGGRTEGGAPVVSRSPTPNKAATAAHHVRSGIFFPVKPAMNGTVKTCTNTTSPSEKTNQEKNDGVHANQSIPTRIKILNSELHIRFLVRYPSLSEIRATPLTFENSESVRGSQRTVNVVKNEARPASVVINPSA